MVILIIILVHVLCCLFQSPKHYIEIWHERPFSLHIAKACEELQWNSNEDAFSVEGVVHYGKSGRVFSRLVKITSEAA